MTAKHWYMHLLKRAQKCKIVFFPDLGIVRNVKPTDVSWYSIPGKANGLRQVDSNTRKCLVMVLRLIKDISKFHDFYNTIFQKYKPKQELNFHFFKKTNVTFFLRWIIWYLFTCQYGARKKSRIRETKHGNANGNGKNHPKRIISKTSRNIPKLAIRPLTRGL